MNKFFNLFKQALKKSIYNFSSTEKIFTKVYANNYWGSHESVSGPGSTLNQTKIVRDEIVKIISVYDIKTLLDIPCGDFNWLSKVNLDIEYIGADIVRDIISLNNDKYKSLNKKFIHLDIISNNLPEVNLILCRDLLVHLNNKQVKKAIDNIKNSNSKYLLATTFTDVYENVDILTGEWRPINLCIPPFNLPDPILVINEQCPADDSQSQSKSLGLWKIQEFLD